MMARMAYVEEREFTLRFELRCEFPEDYDGDADGYAWVAGFPQLASEIVRHAAQAAGRAGWRVRTANRGRSSEDEVTLVLEKAP
jgi:hypothetical protein